MGTGETSRLLGHDYQDVPSAGAMTKDAEDGPLVPYSRKEGGLDEVLFSGENSSIDPKLVTATVLSSLFNLTNTIVGAGALALPFAFRSTGLILGAMVLGVVFVLILFSINILVAATKVSGAETYHGLANAAYGRKGIVVTHLSVVIATFGTMTAYLVIVGDMMSPAIGLLMGGTNDDYCDFWAQRQVPITAALLLVVPLCILRNIDSLQYTSILAVVSIGYLTTIVVVKSGQSFNDGGLDQIETVHFFKLSSEIFRAIPIMTLAFTCHMNLFPIITGLKLPTRRRVRYVTYGAMTVCLVIYATLGVFGYLTFYSFDKVSGNILLNYDVKLPEIVVGRFAVTIVVLFSYPMLGHPCINALDALIFDRPFTYLRRTFMVLVTVGTTYIIAFFVTEVDLVLGVAGSLGSVMISFILPALFYLRIHPDKLTSFRKISSILLVIIGVAALVISTVITILAAVDADPDEDASANECNRTLYNERNSGGGGNGTIPNGTDPNSTGYYYDYY